MDVRYLASVLIIFAIVIIIAWWLIGFYDIYYPGPNRPDANFERLILVFDEFPIDFWFRNNSCFYDDKLECRPQRFIIFESNGDVVYDSYDTAKWRKKCKWGDFEDTEALWNSVESTRAKTLTQGIVIRGKTNNLAEMAKIGDKYRIVHISEYIFDETDPEY